MPLTSQSTALDDIEMSRRIAEKLRASSMEASKMGIDGLAMMEKLAAQGRGEARQAGLDKQAASKLVLERTDRTADNTRADAQLQLAQDAAAATATEKADTKLRLEKADKDKAREALDGRLRLVVKAGLEGGRSPDEIRQRAYDDPTLADVKDDDALMAVVDTEAPGVAAAKAKTDLEREKTQSEIDKNNRGPAGPRAKTPEEIERQRVKDALALQQLKNAEAAGGAKGKPTVKDAEDVTELDRALAEATRLVKEGGEVDTGSFANARNALAQMFSVDDPRVTKFKASVGEQLAQYISSISGATVPDSERAILMQNVPTMNDGNAAFMAKLDRVISMLGSKRAAKVNALNAAGKDTSGLEPKAAAPAPAAPQAPHRDLSDADLDAREAELRKIAGGQ